MVILKNIYVTILALFVGILFLGCAPSGLDFERSEEVSSNAEQGGYIVHTSEEIVPHDTNPLNESVDVIHTVDDGKTYVFGEGDTLKVTVFQEKDLSGDYKVDNSGFISFPLIGKIKAAGLNANGIVRVIEGKLAVGYLRNPDVMVEVSSYRPFSILGEVGAPGNYTYTEGFSIADAVAVAGGFTYRANQKSFELLRRHEGGWDKLEMRVGDDVRPGDIIYVRERMF